MNDNEKNIKPENNLEKTDITFFPELKSEKVKNHTVKKTTKTEIKNKFEELQAAFNSKMTIPIKWRKQQLDNLSNMIKDHSAEIIAALEIDLGKPGTETILTEIEIVLNEIKHTKRHLRRWMKRKIIKLPFNLMPARSYSKPEPVGTILVISPFNYPVQLAFTPIIGAFAAGCNAVIKFSELTVEFNKLFETLISRYFESDVLTTVQGGPETVDDLLNLNFGHIFFTGSSKTGSIIAQKAAEKLIPYTLELGGKSPVWVDSSIEIDQTAETIAWAKFTNCGQTCIAPDYVIIEKRIVNEFLVSLSSAIRKLYGENPLISSDYGKIINKKEFNRLNNYLSNENVSIESGGKAEEKNLKIEPTLITVNSLNIPVMQEEIFGPILPIIPVDNIEESLKLVNLNPNPLTFYAFTTEKSVKELFINNIQSGSIVFNNALIQLSAPNFPFGGIANSGQGTYHGKESFKLFSHYKPIFLQSHSFNFSKIARPPYTDEKIKKINRFVFKNKYK